MPVNVVNLDMWNKVEAKLKAHKLKGSKSKAVVRVGYETYYAIYVHENLEVYHPIGQAKYLSQPMRQYSRQMIDMLNKLIKQRKKSLPDMLYVVGTFLLRKSKELVPIDYGYLYESGFVRIE